MGVLTGRHGNYSKNSFKLKLHSPGPVAFHSGSTQVLLKIQNEMKEFSINECSPLRAQWKDARYVKLNFSQKMTESEKAELIQVEVFLKREDFPKLQKGEFYLTDLNEFSLCNEDSFERAKINNFIWMASAGIENIVCEAIRSDNQEFFSFPWNKDALEVFLDDKRIIYQNLDAWLDFYSSLHLDKK